MAGKDDFKGKFSKEVEKTKVSLEALRSTQKKLEGGLANYKDVWKDIGLILEDIAHIQAQADEAQKQQNINQEKLNDLLDEEGKLRKNLTKAEKNQGKELQKVIAAQQAEVDLLKDKVKTKKEDLATTREAIKGANMLKSIAKDTKKILGQWGLDKIKKTFEISASEVFDMDKSIRNVGRSMGVGGKQFKALSDHLSDSALDTQVMGVNVKELSKLQKGYSEEIGRSVMLSKEGLKAMAGMSEGTGNGEQFAIGMAGAMDKFGGSVETSRDLIEDTMNIAGEMGVNGAKASEMVSKNLKFAQKYKFKNGVKGLAQMSSEALKLKLDLDGIAGLADKVFRPEGAVEMAAKLQTMGGAFAKMANPMELMYKARNDFAGFAKDIGKATSEFVEYNEEQGTFDIKGGLAADRMREIANMTGLGAEKLQEMAAAQAKMNMIGSMTPINLDDKQLGLVESFAEIGKGGEIKVNIDGSMKSIKKLTNDDLDKLTKEKASLEERAKQSRTFMEVLNDLKMQFTTLLLPIARGLKEGLGDPLQELMTDFNKDDGFYKTVKAWGSSVADFIIEFKPVVKYVGKIIKALGVKGVLGVWLASKAFWLAKGALFGRGFRMTAGTGGGMGGGGAAGSAAGKGGAYQGGRMYNKTGYYNNKGQRWSGKGKIPKGSKLMKGGFANRGFGGMGNMAVGMGGMMAGSALKSGREGNYGASGQVMGIGGSALQGAGMGMMMGGPWGAAIGGGLGAAYGAYNEYLSPEAQARAKDRAGGNSSSNSMMVNDGVIQFNPNDKFMQVNDAVVGNQLLASTSPGALDNISKSVETKKVEVSHTLKMIFKSEGSDKTFEDLVKNDPNIMKSIHQGVKELDIGVGTGGISHPNGVRTVVG